MNDDLISRQAAIDALEDAGMTNYLATGDFYGIINALTIIKNLPTIDLSEYCDQLWKIAYERGKKEARPIRCDECKYWDTEWKPAIGEGHYCPMTDQVTDGDEWCSNAERKSDG